jgi:large subunit ribosomal protein L18
MEKKQARLRRARKTRAKIAELKVVRLAVHRSNLHISAQIFSGCGTRVLAAASTMEPEVRTQVPNGGNVNAARTVGKLIAETGQSGRHRAGCLRPLRFSLPRPRESAGRSRP